nr:FkbM family methyltransferase [Nitrosomonas sp.]
VGYYTVLVAELVEPAGRVFAVEPNEKNFEILVANTLSWQEEGRVEVFQTALSDETGSANLFLNSRNCGMHRMYSSVVCTHESVPVTVVRGDELQLEPLDFIKVDIEGYEPRAMRGLKQTLLNSPHVKILSEFSPFSMMEANESPLRWLDWMSKLGFVPLSLDQGKWSSSASSGLIDSVKKLDQVNFSALIRSLDGLDNVTILDRVIQAGKSAGYNRPIVENIFFVRHSEIASIENLILN